MCGFFTTADGAIIIGQPHVASSWYPVNDHPLDKASYRFMVTVPRGLEVVANGHLAGLKLPGSKATWTWVDLLRWRPTWPPRPLVSSK